MGAVVAGALAAGVVAAAAAVAAPAAAGAAVAAGAAAGVEVGGVGATVWANSGAASMVNISIRPMYAIHFIFLWVNHLVGRMSNPPK